ncbi:sigma-54-dependent Fis family transcriptional regulator [Vibrio proteolyticus]|uniref:Putative transcriptional regulator n=1 Tax=Vibrio proteolyticus NBRC 13287 TaxID=1219065 RepID=U3BPV9_VIBPR|nr:sigma-54-dependent Fis family transcriptional regulator [Vibrio proteolyticus]GAD68583.1 putative transcriptional regulator [Vibrio proteolyticus NBRC 13287]
MQLSTPTPDHWLSSSWQRSEKAGLRARRLPDDVRLSPAMLKARREETANLIDAVSAQALPLFNQLFARSDSRLILTDTEGVILASWGQPEFREKLTTIALSSGACWQENLKGTNAIGTALIEQQPVSVIGDQHYILQHRFISCSACPIFDHRGNMIGLLDVTSEQQQHDSSTQLLVQNMVQRIQNQLLNWIPNAALRVDLALDPALLTSGWQGILIADETGLVVAHNQVASQLLAQHPVLGNSVQDVIELTRSPMNLAVATQELGQPTSTTARRSYSASTLLHCGDEQIELAWQQATRVIDQDICLLIVGETGVGKNEFVKALHQQSGRRKAPLVSVNCGALPADLVESELFGYAPGAFTGASPKGYLGKIRQAHQGILFLDEIGDLPPQAQSRLLHVLQDKQVAPVGSNQSETVDIQIIAATHKDLSQLVSEGGFRQDLFYRLNGLLLELPRLAERQDKQALIHTMHQKYAQPADQTLCPALLARLLSYPWPGNLRELDNLLKVAALMAQGEPTLTLNHIPLHLQKTLTQTVSQPAAEKDLRTTVDETLLATYRANQGNISKTSRMLGVSRNTLYRKLKALGVRCKA